MQKKNQAGQQRRSWIEIKSIWYWLSHEESPCSKQDREDHLIQELLLKAQEKWQKEETNLEENLIENRCITYQF